MITDATEARGSQRLLRHLGMAVRGDDEIGARRNSRGPDHLRMGLHVNLQSRGTAGIGQTVLAVGHDYACDLHAMGEKHLKRFHSEMARELRSFSTWMSRARSTSTFERPIRK